MGQVISVELRKHEGARNDAGQVGLLGEVAHLRGQGHLIWRHAAGGTRRDPQINPPTVHMESWPGRGGWADRKERVPVLGNSILT